MQITPFHRSDIEHFYRDHIIVEGDRKAVVFVTTNKEYGYRRFVKQVFQEDVLLPNKSIHFVENTAYTWTEDQGILF